MERTSQIDEFIKHVFSINNKEVIKNNNCAFCNNPNFKFKDKLSKKEYNISGACQNCQDLMFE